MKKIESVVLEDKELYNEIGRNLEDLEYKKDKSLELFQIVLFEGMIKMKTGVNPATFVTELTQKDSEFYKKVEEKYQVKNIFPLISLVKEGKYQSRIDMNVGFKVYSLLHHMSVNCNKTENNIMYEHTKKIAKI